MTDFNNMLEEALKKAVSERGHINVLIAGRSGVGKSTLINSIFQGNIAETGQGKPVTSGTKEYSKEGIPITIFDTRGLEMDDYKNTFDGLKKLVAERCADKDSDRHIHVAWVCVQEDGRRVEDAEIQLHEMLAEKVPVIGIITKARADQGFQKEVKALLPHARNVVRVRAVQETFDDGHAIPPIGLKELIEITSGAIPEGKRRALAAAQKADIGYKVAQSRTVIMGAASLAATAGASPIPFSDAAILAPIQIGMLASISAVFGLELSKAALGTLVSAALGVSGATLVGRTIAVNLLKLIPGAGTIAGGAISAATAGALTITLGEGYSAVLAKFFTENPDSIPTMDQITGRLKEKMR